MRDLKRFIIEEIVKNRKLHDALFYNEHSILETTNEELEQLTIYEGIIQGLELVLKEIENPDNYQENEEPTK